MAFFILNGMKSTLTYYILLVFIIQSLSLQSQDLTSYKWKNRVIILTDTVESLTNSKKQLTRFSTFKKELSERDVVILLHYKGKLYDQREKLLSQKIDFSIEPSFCGVHLVGKDGGVKLKKPYPVEPNSILELIDSMPIRRAEMRN
jgi:hypothetical protein